MTWEKFFSVAIRLVFVFAFAAFLQASMSHVATFFHNFEPQDTGWVGSYMLAIAVDGTALMLTIGMMFFSHNMPTGARIIVWFFIFCLTAFSWLVNWEYAVTFQSDAITGHLAPVWRDINPILASSFAFLNLAYSVVADFFTLRRKSVRELQSELAELTGEKATLERQIKEAKGPGLIVTLAGKAKEVKAAVKEVVTDGDETPSQAQPVGVQPEVIAEVPATVTDVGAMEERTEVVSTVPEAQSEPVEPPREEPITAPEMNAVNVTTFPGTGSVKRSKDTVKLNDLAPAIDITTRRKPLTISEAVQVLGVSEKTVREWKRSGRLSTSADGKAITVSSVRKMVESRQEKAS